MARTGNQSRNVGFRYRSDAQQALNLARQWGRSKLPVHGNSWLLKAPVGGVPAATDDTTPGKADCTPYYIVENPPDTFKVEELKPSNGQGTTVQTFNLTKEEIAENSYFLAWVVGNRAVISTPEGAKESRIRFKAITKIVDRKFDATVDFVVGNVTRTHPDALGDPINIGDEEPITDPNNMWGEIEPDCYGWAYYRPARTYPDDVDDPADEHDARWEVEDCSLPINEVVAKIDTCLYHNDSQKSATVGPDPTDWNLSSYNNANIPPEWTSSGTDQWDITFFNDLKLHAVKDSYVVLQRQTDVRWTDVDNIEVPKAQSATTVKWICTHVYKPIARYTCATKSGSSWSQTDFWDGFDPQQCVTTYTAGCLDDSCLKDGDVGVFSYAPEVGATGEYRLISSQSAALGTPKKQRVQISAPQSSWSCDVESGNVCIDTSQYYKEIAAFDCIPGEDPLTDDTQETTQACVNSKELLDCLRVCEYICLYCEEFSGSEECNECCCDCRFPESDPISSLSGSTTGESASKSGDSARIDPCTFQVPMDNGTNWTVKYLCDGNWSIEYSLGGSGGTAVGVGDCTTATDWTASDPNLTLSMSANGEICEDPPPVPCCQDCLFRPEWINGLTLQLQQDVTTQNGAATFINECEFDVPMDDGTTSRVNYTGTGNWVVTNPVWGTWNGTGDCNGAALQVQGGEDLGSVSAVADDCGACCQFSDQVVLTGFSAAYGDVTITQNGTSARGASGACSASFNVPVLVDDQAQGQSRNATATVTLRYDDVIGDCVWDVSIPQGVPQVPATAIAAAGCEGTMSCEDPSGDCDPDGDGDGYDSLSFTVNDPVNDPVCTDPNAGGMGMSMAAIPGSMQKMSPRERVIARRGNTEKPGTKLEQMAPELFAKCRGCRSTQRDVARRMDSIGCDGSMAEIDALARQIHGKLHKSHLESVRGYTVDMVKQLMIQAVEAARQ